MIIKLIRFLLRFTSGYHLHQNPGKKKMKASILAPNITPFSKLNITGDPTFAKLNSTLANGIEKMNKIKEGK